MLHFLHSCFVSYALIFDFTLPTCQVIIAGKCLLNVCACFLRYNFRRSEVCDMLQKQMLDKGVLGLAKVGVSSL